MWKPNEAIKFLKALRGSSISDGNVFEATKGIGSHKKMIVLLKNYSILRMLFQYSCT